MCARNRDLEEQIFADPSDPAAYLVYADWLQAQGDPRGELIVLHHNDGNADAFIIEHDHELLGRFADDHPATFDLTWRLGFVQKATIGWEMFGGEDDDDSSVDQLRAFLALDSTRFIEELSLGPTPDEDEMDLGKLADAIDEAKPRALRTLYLGDTADWDISGTSTRMPSSESTPNLRELTLRGGAVTLDEQIDLPELTKLRVETGGLTKTELVAIANARWPKLVELELWFGDPNYGATGGTAEIASIFTGKGLAELRVLKLRNCPFADDVALALIDSLILPQLRVVDLSMGNLSDRGLAAMMAKASRFAHLDQLVLEDNALTNAHWPAARTLAKNVAFGVEHEPSRAVPREGKSYARYVTVGE
jgi:uncharacterized protein (TIGR02996 family)